MNIVNLTPHEITIQTASGQMLAIDPSGQIARVAEQREELGELAGIPITRATYGAVEGLPAPAENTVYVVSALVLQAVGAERADVFAPGPAIRDENGRVVACEGLSAGVAYRPQLCSALIRAVKRAHPDLALRQIGARLAEAGLIQQNGSTSFESLPLPLSLEEAVEKALALFV